MPRTARALPVICKLRHSHPPEHYERLFERLPRTRDNSPARTCGTSPVAKMGRPAAGGHGYALGQVSGWQTLLEFLALADELTAAVIEGCRIRRRRTPEGGRNQLGHASPISPDRQPNSEQHDRGSDRPAAYAISPSVAAWCPVAGSRARRDRRAPSALPRPTSCAARGRAAGT